jgi:hypothetical protein
MHQKLPASDYDTITDPTARERFMALTDVSGGDDACWPWMGAARADGYGTFYPREYLGKGMAASRASWLLFRWPIKAFSRWDVAARTERLVVMHRCDNRLCVNPGHLTLGTNLDNATDMSAKGRGPRKPKGKARERAEAAVRAVMELYDSGLTRAQVSKRTGVEYGTVCAILRGQAWTYMTRHRREMHAAEAEHRRDKIRAQYVSIRARTTSRN